MNFNSIKVDSEEASFNLSTIHFIMKKNCNNLISASSKFD